ncbi:MAG: branched-chain-amino-acid transaminase, partial [Deltaproteobacteria bacterium]|nr:branched-chain-amino-acid transaminase [Deltaproteobacteria bacterium]
EGIRCYEGDDGKSIVFRLKEHTKRLFESAKIVQIEMPFTEDEVNAAIIETLQKNDLKAAYIRVIAFLGEGSMGLYPKDNRVSVAVAAWPWGAYLGEDGMEKGIRTKISSFARHHINAAMTKAKVCGSYVNSILAKREAVKGGYDEAILLDTDGYVSEGSGENIFMVRNGIIKTTPITTVLDGITRDAVIKIARAAGLEVVEARFTRDELYIADEAFFTGTAAEITPIREVDDRVIGTGKPGPITKQIQKTYFDIICGRNNDYNSWRYPV